MLPKGNSSEVQRQTQDQSGGRYPNQVVSKEKWVQPFLYERNQISGQKNVTRDKDGHFKMIKETIHQDITFINLYTLNFESPKYIMQLLTDLKGEIDHNTIIIGDLNIPCTSIN